MRLSALAAQKSHSRLVPQNGFHGDPHVPGGGLHGAPERVTGGALDLAGGASPRQSLQAATLDFPQGRGKRRRLGGGGTAVRGEAGWCRKQPRAVRPAVFRDPGFHPLPPPPPLPQTLALQVPGGRGPRRHGAGWPWRGTRGVRMRRAAAAPSRARLDAKAGGAAELPRTLRAARAATARGPQPGRGAGNHAAPPAS